MAVEHGYGRIVTDGLVLLLDAADNSSYPGSGNSKWYNLVGNWDNGTLKNGISHITNNLGTFTFDGSNDYIDIPQPNVSYSPNRFTILIWMKPGSRSSFFLTPNSAGIDHFLRYDNSNKRFGVQITKSADTNNRTIYAPSNSVPINVWTHIGISIDNLTVKLYVNGTNTTTSLQTISIANWTGTWRLGQRGNSTNWYLGLIASLHCFNRALTPQEVQQNYNATKTRFGL